MRQITRREFLRGTAAGALGVVLTGFVGEPSSALAEEGSTTSVADVGIDVAEFTNPSKAYQPGVRWWWLGDANMSRVLESHSNIRALFNDSYEFYSDLYYTESMAEFAADAENNGLGYDFSKYLPTIYKQYSAAPFYMGLGTTDTYLTYTADDSEKTRIEHDYNLLVNQKFQSGMEAFQAGSAAYGLLYRQEAYNPPIDTLASANYIDIPEAEQASELTLMRAASGAHLYGKNLVTCEQYTLGCTSLAFPIIR